MDYWISPCFKMECPVTQRLICLEISRMIFIFWCVRDRAGALVRLEAAVETIRASPLVERCGINVPQAPASLGAPDLLDTAKAAAKAVHAVEAATKDDGSAHEVQGTPILPSHQGLSRAQRFLLLGVSVLLYIDAFFA